MTGFDALGVSELEPIRENQRFHTYRGMLNGRAVFVKRPASTSERLVAAHRSELWGLMSFHEINRLEQLSFRVPELLAYGDDYLVTEYIEGSAPRLDPHDADYENILTFLARGLAEVDERTLSAHRRLSKVSLRYPNGQTFVERLRERLSTVNYREYFEQELIEEALSLIDEKHELLEARFTHADFTENNALLMADGTFALIDFDSCSMSWPRWYDVVDVTFNRRVRRPELSDGMKRVMGEYFERIGEDQGAHKSALHVVALIRGLTLILDVMTAPNAMVETRESMSLDLSLRIKDALQASIENRFYE